MRPSVCIATAAAVAAALLAGPANAAKTTTVTLKNVKFAPKTVRVDKGSRVRWVWKDGSTPHDVASRGSRRFKSSALKTSGDHVVRFTKTGTYGYICTIHPGMTGKVVVR